MGVVIREPTLIDVPQDLKHTIVKDKKEEATNDDTWEAAAFNIDMDHYSELCSKNFLELEEKLEVKKYNLALHYRVDHKIHPSLSRPLIGRSTAQYGITISANMKLHDTILEWCSRSRFDIKDIA